MNKKKLFVFIFLIALFSGCGTKIELAEFSKASILKSDYMPNDNELKGKKTNILILKFDENNINLAISSALGSTVAGAIDGELSKANSVSVIKRIENSINIKKELEASELSKGLNIDTGAAEYLITGKIISAYFDREFVASKTYKDSKKRIKVIPAKNIYKACSSGTVQIYELPSLANVKSFPFENCVSKTEEAISRYNYNSSIDDSLVRESGVQGIAYMSKNLKEFFALKGYIIEKRVNNSNETILLTTLGSSLGAIESATIDIYTIKGIKNPINNQIIKQPMKIAKGEISNQISTDSSWIVVKEINKGENIKIGDYIKISYRGFFD